MYDMKEVAASKQEGIEVDILAVRELAVAKV